ncbi:MAG TPA: CRTAC1 family protein [Myxococcota bacterium]|nr:CRTAC1 family protein [Myxococcota bacterium]
MIWLLLACKGDPTQDSQGGLEPICVDDASWSAGTRAFTNATESWELDSLAATGIRISAVDFDGDGWTDLVVRGGHGVDSSSRNTWLLRNTGERSFEDVTGELPSRSGAVREGANWVFADVDGDGDLDAFSGLADSDGSLEPETSEILLNDGTGVFSLGSEDLELRRGSGDMPYGAAFADVDGDGHVDLWVTEYPSSNYQTDRFYAGDGAGGFTDLTKDRGLKTIAWSAVSDLNAGLGHSVAWSALACDLDDDGRPELLASSYGRAPNHLWHNDGTGHFENVSVSSGYAYDERTDWSDNESARCWCKLHPDDDDCEGVPEPERIACNTDSDAFRWSHSSDREAYRLGGNSGATMCGDVDNDGLADLLTTEIVHWDGGSSSDPAELLFNAGDVVFERPGNEVTGLVREHDRVDWNDGDITGSLFDFDNDGWLDVYIGDSDYPDSRGRLWRQTAPRQFEGVPIEDGIDHFRSHGSAVADFDRDGDLDIAVGHSGARCDSDCYDEMHVRMFENQLGGNFVQLRLRATTGSNSAAIGARVRLTTGFTQTHEVTGGHGQWGAQDDLVVHFGMGEACTGALEVRWPSGDVETFDVMSGYLYEVVEGEGAIIP